MGVADAQISVTTKLPRPRTRDLKHRRTELDARQPHIFAVVRQVAAGAERDLQHITCRLRTDPLAPTGKQQPLEDAHLAVILLRFLLVDTEDALGLARPMRVERLDGVSHGNSPRPFA